MSSIEVIIMPSMRQRVTAFVENGTVQHTAGAYFDKCHHAGAGNDADSDGGGRCDFEQWLDKTY
jgi:hypothetical protein